MPPIPPFRGTKIPTIDLLMDENSTKTPRSTGLQTLRHGDRLLPRMPRGCRVGRLACSIPFMGRFVYIYIYIIYIYTHTYLSTLKEASKKFLVRNTTVAYWFSCMVYSPTFTIKKSTIHRSVKYRSLSHGSVMGGSVDGDFPVFGMERRG